VLSGRSLRQSLGAIADGFVTSPAFRWTWSAPDSGKIQNKLLEVRPADAHSVADMMQGQYLMAQRLVDTGGTSPFAVDYGTKEWSDELHSFSWLRHFTAAMDDGSKRFAGTLTMDWVARYGRFSKKVWDNETTALRVLNWLKHFDSLVYGFNDSRRAVVERSLVEQVQSLRVRINFEADPARRLLMRLALLGAGLACQKTQAELNVLVERTLLSLTRQIDKDGMHKSRNGEQQFLLLMEMIPLRHAISPVAPDLAKRFGQTLDRMHRSLALLMHTTGEIAYFNGARSVPHELLLAVQSRAAGGLEFSDAEIDAGYASLVGKDSKLIVDSGCDLGEDFTAHLSAGAGSFEYSFRNDLIVTNCGVGPSSLGEDAELFRLPASHSTLEIEYQGAFPLRLDKLLKQHMLDNRNNQATCDVGDMRVDVQNMGYSTLAGVKHTRSMNVLTKEGDVLIGQDILSCDLTHKNAPDQFLFRFHLGPGVKAQMNDASNQIELVLRSGATWAFIWEGAEAMVEGSARYSAHKGLESIQQIVLTGSVHAELEVVWTFMPRLV